MVIDLFGLQSDEVRSRFPEVYQHLLRAVKPEREAVFENSKTNDAAAYAAEWWLFGKPRQQLRPALKGLSRYIVTVETTKHRVFQFLDGAVLPDNMLVNIVADDAYVLGVLSSRAHLTWTSAQGGTLEDRPRYTKSQCFDPFPFPNAERLPEAAYSRDRRRPGRTPKARARGPPAPHSDWAVQRAGAAPRWCRSRCADGGEKRIFDDGLVLILKELHDKLDAAIADAYGWPNDLTDEDMLARLVALNKERAREEARGRVRWLRPEYQIPRFGTAKEKAELDLVGGGVGVEAPVGAGRRSTFPSDDFAQTAAVMAALASAFAPLNAAAIAAGFRQGRKDCAEGPCGARRSRSHGVCDDHRRRRDIHIKARRLKV